METSIISARVEAVRQFLSANNLAAYIFPSCDPHGSEYPPAHWQIREWVSGFDGSAGTAVVALSDAALWTDNRYLLAAEQQLAGTPISLMKQGLTDTPSIVQWLVNSLPQGSRVGADGWLLTEPERQQMAADLSAHGLELVLAPNPADSLWADRPALPQAPIFIHPLEYAGESAHSKLARMRGEMTLLGAEALLVGKLDDVAWLANIRCNDVLCNPVAVAYLWIDNDKAVLYIDEAKVDAYTRATLQGEGIACKPYASLATELSTSGVRGILFDGGVSAVLYASLPAGCTVVKTPSPVTTAKAIKNAAEIAGFRAAMLRDGVAMVRFLHWLQPAVEAGGQTEMSVTAKLETFRAEQALYQGLSFETITAYAHHGAIVHYSPSAETDIPLLPKGLLLIDSGGQYTDGTTDITRTISLGALTAQESMDYTLVLRGHIRLAMARFPDGATGTQLDALARFAMWQEGINYLHGTGHGVGAYLSVHEGPHQIRMNHVPAPLHTGMTVTNEPGIYRAGQHGVRIENTMLIESSVETEFGKFLQLSPLTLCPIDTKPIQLERMQADEIAYLNAYHAKVYRELSPYLSTAECAWLAEATKPLCR